MVTHYEMQKAATKFFAAVWAEARKDLNKSIPCSEIMGMMLKCGLAEWPDVQFQLTELGNEAMKDGGASDFEDGLGSGKVGCQ